MGLPTGTVTFLFSDVEDSTQLAQALGRDGFRRIVETQAGLIRDVVDVHAGVVVSVEGDGIFAVFERAERAVLAAVAAQRQLSAHVWPDGGSLRVRIGMHTGEGLLGGANYLGVDVHRAARIADAGHGGQILVSEATWALVSRGLPEDVELRELGEHRLKGLDQPERIFQVAAEGLTGEFPPLRAASVRGERLPGALTSFVGRVEQVEELSTLVEQSRLVTVTGAGGVGKTRLATQVAHGVSDTFADGVAVVELAGVSEGEHVAATIARALGVPERRDRDVTELLRSFVVSRELLLVLDNCEHLVEPVAVLVSDLLAVSRRLRVLATSRELLRVPGEQIYALRPMDVPAESDDAGEDDRLGSEAVQLLVDRARTAGRELDLTDPATADAVVRICRQVEGIPLAIELAAARARAMSVGEIAGRLADRFGLLTEGSRVGPAHHHTLEATLAWSHDLLTDAERVLFRRLAVFAGGFTLDAAEKVCADEQMSRSDVLSNLSHLVDKSLVVVAGGSGRYRMLETVREYAGDQLARAGEAEPTRRAFADYFVELAERGGQELRGAEQLSWLRKLRDEHDNLRATLEWLVNTGQADTAVRTATALRWFWTLSSTFREGVRYLSRALDLPGHVSDEHRGIALLMLADIAIDIEAAENSAREAVAIFTCLDDDAGIADSLLELAYRQLERGDIEQAEILGSQALQRAQKAGDRHTELIVSIFYGHLLRNLERTDEAAELFQRSRTLAKQTGDVWFTALANSGLCDTARDLGDLDRAVSLGEQAAATLRLFDSPGYLARALYSLGIAQRIRGNFDEAIRLLEEALELRRRAPTGHTYQDLFQLGATHLEAQDTGQAILWLRDCLTMIAQRVNTGWSQIPLLFTRLALNCLAHATLRLGDPHAAARLLGASDAVAETLAIPLSVYKEGLEAATSATRTELDDETFERRYAEGQAMTPDEAVTYALKASETRQPHHPCS